MPTSTPTISSSRRPRANATKSKARRPTANSAERSRSGPLTWCLDDCLWFASKLTLPDGSPLVLEPFQIFILRELFARNRVELLVLLPKGNGKTTLFALVAVFHLLTVANAQCFIGAADKEQAREMYRFAAHFVESEPEIHAILLVRESTKEIRGRRGGLIKVLASDTSSAGGRRHSYNPTLALIDELHAHQNPNLYTALRSALFKAGGLIVTITTAGHDPDGTLGQLRAGMLAFAENGGSVTTGLVVNNQARTVRGKNNTGRLTVARSATGGTVMLEWACRPDEDLGDPQIVKLANPATFVTLESLVDALEAPGITPWEFARYRANVWTLAFQSWLPDGAWDALAAPGKRIPLGSEIVAAVDMARYRDCAAITVVWPRPGEAPFATCRPGDELLVWRSGGHDNPVDYATVKDAIRWLHEHFDLREVAYDPKYFDQSAGELEAEGIVMVEFPQSNERMCPASAELRKEITAGRLEHDGDPTFAAHVAAGVAKDVGETEWKLTKSRRSGPPIDALIALVMAFARAGVRKKTPFVMVIGG